MGTEETSRHITQHQMMDSASSLQIRLDATKILEDFETYLTGKVRFTYYDEKGNPHYEFRQIADTKANAKGIHWILSFLGGVINHAVVQGNFPEDKNGHSSHYEIYIDFIWDSLLTNLMENLYEWGIHESDYQPIIDRMMATIIPFASRLIGNKERESYAQSIREKETKDVSKLKTQLPFTN